MSLLIVTVNEEKVRPAIVVVINPVDPKTMAIDCTINIAADARRNAYISELDFLG